MISIHVPREGHDKRLQKIIVRYAKFQSTCPARGTTFDFVFTSPPYFISIHVPREGHDRILQHVTLLSL